MQEFNLEFKLGKREKRADRRTLQLKNYLQAPIPPKHCNWVSGIPQWPMYGNDTLGDCVIAAAGHAVGQWTYKANKNEALLSSAQIIQGYRDVGGYVPGDPTTDNGCDMLTALNYWRKTGFGGHKILAFAEVNPQNMNEVEQAIWLFGNLYTGVQLPISVQGKDFWALPSSLSGDGAPGSWGGHCIPIMSYDNSAMCCVTWGQTLDLSRAFFSAYADECYVALSTDWLNAHTDLSPGNLNLGQLQADLHSVVNVAKSDPFGGCYQSS